MIAFTILAPAPYLNANEGGHWAPRAATIAIWRAHVANYAARVTPQIESFPIDLFIRLDVPDKRRRDPANWAPTTKVICDALGPGRTYVNRRGALVHSPGAGWWPDDTPEYVRTHEPELRPVGRRTGLTVTITVKERT